MNEDLMKFANNLKMLREEQGLTLRELARKTGISRATLNEYELATVDPSLSRVIILANFFNEDINWLVGVSKIRSLKKIAQ